ncbi:DUF1800 domain-containing protein [Desertivirga arenae]|uniref:DUF1800 domain-containing protein n=1 Tax=Desertivirga arenae TaxID=2810309 RepID=UPI001A9695AD|nr:DUF1800 domain-containing protein [Pedobacter sp. SYSU D00823]
MKSPFSLQSTFLIALIALFFISFSSENFNSAPKYKFPYKQAGLTERQAAVHLLSRFTYGAKPGQVDEVMKEGLEKWFNQQLQARLEDDSLNNLLSDYKTLKLSSEEIVRTYPQNGFIIRQAVKEGVIDKDSVASVGKQGYRGLVRNYMEQRGYKPQQELFRELINQKILRSAYSKNQLQEVLTDFWFNHFNVSLTKNQCAEYVLPYERDAIRPNSLGRFEDLLFATAKSPAMLFYLDNFSSSGPAKDNPKVAAAMKYAEEGMMQGDSMMNKRLSQLAKNKKNQGLNENYAREVMELHTLGVEGGYTQNDVTQAARVLTGWTVYPAGEGAAGNQIIKLIERVGEENMAKKGYVHEGGFMFVPTRHDEGEKIVLGRKFIDGGYQEGVKLLQMLASHPSTARFISQKLAIRFVSDNPSPSLINKMAKTFTEKSGDIRQVLITMVSSPEFWTKEALREKTKSPFELAISTVRCLDAKVDQPYQLFNWMNKMGQKIYYYQAPTGFPDRGQYWINTGSLLNRMNFGLAIASGRIPGVKANLLALNQNHEPESAASALQKYSQLILPERDVQVTVKRLTPLLNDPNLNTKVEAAAAKTSQATTSMQESPVDMQLQSDRSQKVKGINKSGKISLQTSTGTNTMLAQVVGVIIGSPEFQRR